MFTVFPLSTHLRMSLFPAHFFSRVGLWTVSNTPRPSNYNFPDSQYIARNRRTVESELPVYVVNDGLQFTVQDHEELAGFK